MSPEELSVRRMHHHKGSLPSVCSGFMSWPEKLFSRFNVFLSRESLLYQSMYGKMTSVDGRLGYRKSSGGIFKNKLRLLTALWGSSHSLNGNWVLGRRRQPSRLHGQTTYARWKLELPVRAVDWVKASKIISCARYYC